MPTEALLEQPETITIEKVENSTLSDQITSNPIFDRERNSQPDEYDTPEFRERLIAHFREAVRLAQADHRLKAE